MKTNKKSRLIVCIALVLLIISIMSNVYAFRYETDFFSIEPPSGFEKSNYEGYTDNSYYTEYKNTNMSMRVEVEKMEVGEAKKQYELLMNLIEDTSEYQGKTVDNRSTLGPSDYDIYTATVKTTRTYTKYYFIATDNYFLTITCRTNGRRQFLYNEKAFDNTVKTIEIFDTVTDPQVEVNKVKIAYIIVFAVLFIIVILFIKFIKKLLKDQEAAKAYSSYMDNNEPKEDTEGKKYNNYENTKEDNKEKEKPKYTYNPGYNYNFEVGKDNKGSYYSQSDLNKYIKNEENDGGQGNDDNQ